VPSSTQIRHHNRRRYIFSNTIFSNTFLAITVLGVWSIYNNYDFISTNEKKADGRLRGVDNEQAARKAAREKFAAMAALRTETILTVGANADEERAAEVAKAKAKEAKVKEIKAAAEAKANAEAEAAMEANTEEDNAAADAKETARAKVAAKTKAKAATETEAEAATEGAADATVDPVIADAGKKTDAAAHEIRDLSCINYGGPLQRSDVLDIVYWNDIVSDSNFTSPFHDQEKYLTFEPDPSGKFLTHFFQLLSLFCYVYFCNKEFSTA